MQNSFQPQRDLNTQPFDLDSDGLPLRHKVLRLIFPAFIKRGLQILSGVSRLCDQLFNPLLFERDFFSNTARLSNKPSFKLKGFCNRLFGNDKISRFTYFTIVWSVQRAKPLQECKAKNIFSIVYVFFNPVFCNVVSRIEAKVFLKCRKLNHLSFWSRNICPTSSQRLARLSLLTVNCTKVWKKSISESSNMPYE